MGHPTGTNFCKGQLESGEKTRERGQERSNPYARRRQFEKNDRKVEEKKRPRGKGKVWGARRRGEKCPKVNKRSIDGGEGIPSTENNLTSVGEGNRKMV